MGDNPKISLSNSSATHLPAETSLLSLTREVSPPPHPSKTRRVRNDYEQNTSLESYKLHDHGSSIGQGATVTTCNASTTPPERSKTAAIEAGEIKVDDPVEYFMLKLGSIANTRRTFGSSSASKDSHDRDYNPGRSLTYQRPVNFSSKEWSSLYHDNAHSANGHHFVIHQHDHPIAGTHYDLRVQCNGTSSISFAIMYGLPGDVNSRRLNRNATETRVHCLWNHLIETASLQTGSLLIWDTGTYEVLPYLDKQDGKKDETDSDSDDAVADVEEHVTNIDGRQKSKLASEQQKLQDAFQKRKIKLRLTGTRLPPGYTISLRLTQDNFRNEQPDRPLFRRKRKRTESETPPARSSDSDEEEDSRTLRRTVSSLSRAASPPATSSETFSAAKVDSGSESEMIRRNNAYTGAINSVNSIHQRRWFLSLDRRNSGFIPSKTEVYGNRIWIRGRDSDGKKTGFERFHVLGRDVERSVVTGRLASDILTDEGVVGFVPRGHWRPVVE